MAEAPEAATVTKEPGERLARKRRGLPDYSLIFFRVLLCCVALLGVLIISADRLSRFGLTQQVHYLVLVLMALSAAVLHFLLLSASAAHMLSTHFPKRVAVRSRGLGRKAFHILHNGSPQPVLIWNGGESRISKP